MSTADAKLPSIPKLSRATFTVWKPRMQALLMARGLWGYVSGAVKKEGVTDAKALELFDSNSQTVCGLLFLNVDEEMETFIVDKLDSQDAPAM